VQHLSPSCEEDIDEDAVEEEEEVKSAGDDVKPTEARRKRKPHTDGNQSWDSIQATFYARSNGVVDVLRAKFGDADSHASKFHMHYLSGVSQCTGCPATPAAAAKEIADWARTCGQTLSLTEFFKMRHIRSQIASIEEQNVEISVRSGNFDGAQREMEASDEDLTGLRVELAKLEAKRDGTTCDSE